MLFVFAVDEEFEAVATEVLMRTQSMVNKYRRLLMVEAEVGLAWLQKKKIVILLQWYFKEFVLVPMEKHNMSQFWILLS